LEGSFGITKGLVGWDTENKLGFGGVDRDGQEACQYRQIFMIEI
jgi:hypothetical protein